MHIFEYIFTYPTTNRDSKACQAFLGFAKIYLNSHYLVSFRLLFLKTKYHYLFFMTINVAINLLAFFFYLRRYHRKVKKNNQVQVREDKIF